MQQPQMLKYVNDLPVVHFGVLHSLYLLHKCSTGIHWRVIESRRCNSAKN